jgi:hypothetical protein
LHYYPGDSQAMRFPSPLEPVSKLSEPLGHEANHGDVDKGFGTLG